MLCFYYYYYYYYFFTFAVFEGWAVVHMIAPPLRCVWAVLVGTWVCILVLGLKQIRTRSWGLALDISRVGTQAWVLAWLCGGSGNPD